MIQPPQITRTIKVLAIATGVAFVLQQVVDRSSSGAFTQAFGLVPYGFAVQFRFWQILTYMFLHGDVMHLVLNLLMLIFIGSELESKWGARRFLVFYAISGAVAGLSYLFLRMVFWDQGGLQIPLVGASGGIYGLLIAYGILFSERQLLFMMIFPMKAKHFIWVLAGVEFLTTLFSPGGEYSSVAHLGGMAGGFLYLVFLNYRLARKNTADFLKKYTQLKRKAAASQKSGGAGKLKLVINNDPDRGKKSFDDEDPNSSDPKTWH